MRLCVCGVCLVWGGGSAFLAAMRVRLCVRCVSGFGGEIAVERGVMWVRV